VLCFSKWRLYPQPLNQNHAHNFFIKIIQRSLTRKKYKYQTEAASLTIDIVTSTSLMRGWPCRGLMPRPHTNANHKKKLEASPKCPKTSREHKPVQQTLKAHHSTRLISPSTIFLRPIFRKDRVIDLAGSAVYASMAPDNVATLHS
jgi:hypothetical protein